MWGHAKTSGPWPAPDKEFKEVAMLPDVTELRDRLKALEERLELLRGHL
jgi:hypothetical protein